MIITLLCLFFLLIAVHFVLDFPLQGDTVAINKNPNANTELQKSINWKYWMTAHAFSHGLGVAIVFLFAQCLFFELNEEILAVPVILGLLETMVHFFTDYKKCQGELTMFQDQLIHIVYKATWLAIWVGALYLNNGV